MKISNITKEYCEASIKRINKIIKEYKSTIRKCDILIAKEKPLLNNSKLSHDKLWLLRDERKDAIKNLRNYKSEMTTYHKLLTLFYTNPQLKTETYNINITREYYD